MTVNELEQGLRNLIASQPMVLSGVNGEIVNNALAIIDAYRNFNFRVQSYPYQDVLKVNLSNESAKTEVTLSNLVCQVLQERGINLLLYMQTPGAQQYGPMINQYGMVTQQMDPNLMMGQMMYTQGAIPQNVGMMQMPNSMPNMGRQQPYSQMHANMQGVAQGGYLTPRAGQRRQPQTFPGYEPVSGPVRLEPVQKSEQMMKTRSAPQSKIKQIPKQNTMRHIEKTPSEPTMVQETANVPVNETAEMLMGANNEVSSQGGKAAGRDYLMELLKK